MKREKLNEMIDELILLVEGRMAGRMFTPKVNDFIAEKQKKIVDYALGLTGIGE